MYQNSLKNFLAKYPNTLHIHHSSFFAFFSFKLGHWFAVADVKLLLTTSVVCQCHHHRTRPGGTVLKLVGTSNCKIRQRCKTITMHSNVSYVMEFLTWWVLKSKVFAQKSTVVKWNWCIFWIDMAWVLQKLGPILENKMF